MKLANPLHVFSALLAAALVLGGCSTPGSLPDEDQRPIAIATQAYETEFKVREFDIGRGRNAGKGAGAGFIQGAMAPFAMCDSNCGDGAVFLLLLAPFTAAAGTVIGAMAGAASKPEVDFDRIDKVDQKAVETLLIPKLAPRFSAESLRAAILRPARHATDRPLVPAERRVDANAPYFQNATTGLPTGAFAHVLAARIVEVDVVSREINDTQRFGLLIWADVAFADADGPSDRFWSKSKRLRYISNYHELGAWQDEARFQHLVQDALDGLGLSIAKTLM
jgi:hypothetical protein